MGEISHITASELNEAAETALRTLADALTAAEGYMTLETSALVLLGALAVAAGGRVLLALAAAVFSMTLAQRAGLVAELPDWAAVAFSIALLVALIHLVLGLLLGEQVAGTMTAALVVGIIVLILLKPLALMRVPGFARLLSRIGGK